MMAILKEPNKNNRLINIDNIDQIKELVGEHLEWLQIGNSLLIFNEDGRMLNLERNLSIGYTYLVGNVVMIGTDGEDFTDVDFDDVAYIDMINML